jgi:signal transduction histidine kinase
MLKPISFISAQANNISETNLHLRLSEGNRKDELAELSMTINKMLYRLESAFELQKNFVANASHELRTPLTSIIGNIEVTLSKARTIEEHKVVLDSIMLEAEKLHKLTNGLLDLAQSNLDFSNLIKEEIRLDELLIELKDEMHIKRPESNIKIIFPEMPESPSALTISGNRNLFYIAIFNLLDNACKFSDGKIVIASLVLDTGSISIVFKDSGIGIEENELPFIIETFYRAPNARSYAGSGIGLALASRIIHLHGGKMEIKSSMNTGTEVTVSFQIT